MASPFPGQVSAFQIGSYFVSNYYNLLQSHPQLVHQFYTNMSTMVRLDTNTMEATTASGMLQVHNILMGLSLNGIEIKTAQFLDSWSRGILVMVSGFVQPKEYAARRRFSQTFFLAPQEKGYFVLNDIFHLLGDESVNQYAVPVGGFLQTGYETKLPISNPVPDPVPSYTKGEEIQAKDLPSPAPPVLEETNEMVDKYSIHEPPAQHPQQQLQLVSFSDPEPVINETPLEEPVTVVTAAPPPVPSLANTQPDPPPSVTPPAVTPRAVPVSIPSRPALPEEEPVSEMPKTYASVLRAKGQTGQVTSHPVTVSKINAVPESQQNSAVAQNTTTEQQLQQLQLQSSVPLLEKPSFDSFNESAALEDEGESLSVYVGNLSPSTSVPDLEQEFKLFGRIKPDGVAIRSRKETGAFFAFVEFEDMTGVQNALKASAIQLNGRQIHIEGRRPNSGASRGGRRGRGGRGGYPMESSRGRFGGRSSYAGDRDYMNRPRGNGYQRRAPLNTFDSAASRNGPSDGF